ncbi:MAG: hypothetical protein MRJ96_04480 [Nitrospirales bacterium]|nr:hypothetical protein [Nitrospira sp.]MDR4500698.1 hypothetical protein [Nitrospirales bacterium]
MEWGFIAGGMYLLALLTMFVMTLTSSQGPSMPEDEETSQEKPDKAIDKKAA